MLLLGWFVVELLALKIVASNVIARSNIIQTVPPAVKYGVNYEAFDQLTGLFVRKITFSHFSLFDCKTHLKNLITGTKTMTPMGLFGRKVDCLKVISCLTLITETVLSMNRCDGKTEQFRSSLKKSISTTKKSKRSCQQLKSFTRKLVCDSNRTNQATSIGSLSPETNQVAGLTLE